MVQRPINVRDTLGDMAIGDVTGEDLLPIIKKTRATRSQKTYRTNICTMFAWCKKQEYLNPQRPSVAEQLHQIKVDKPPPQILKIHEARRLLTEIKDVRSLLYLSISLFTGMRLSELQRIDWESFNPAESVIFMDVDKRPGKNRRIPIHPVLAAWLTPFYGHSGLVMPVTGIRDKVSALAKGLRIRWKRNWCRHSYASYRLAQTGSPAQTAAEDGHSPYILERDYLHRVNAKDAEHYFALTPESCGQEYWEQRVKKFLSENPPVKAPKRNKSAGPRPIIPQDAYASDPDASDNATQSGQLPLL